MKFKPIKKFLAAFALTAAALTMSPVGIAFTPSAKAALLDEQQEAAVDAIIKRLNGLKRFWRTFIQTGPNGERSQGRVFMQRPGKLRFDYGTPHPMLIIANGRWVAVEDRKANTTDQYPVKLTPLRFLLADEINLREDAEITNVFTGPETVEIILREKSDKIPGQLSLLFNSQDYSLLQWTVTDAQGLNTSVALYDIEEGQKLSPRLFYIDLNIDPMKMSDR